ncbi:MAG: alpha-L-fucosidase [Eubacterium coprostanoligenes]|uniref:alpha-L-fucosidase n=1 Tax=Eubacterium coprostanoligenes TaxID=290054 RepID=UPI0023542479|nr:alpha-L-fucosidase [Eubacterium coprostanoligenes]MCI7264771.1 alpha-L-fucosidase [Eubacterium coprostanoligenes]MDD7358673.1 alpha-L-fucosidase [Eubacterium coprostanoligenes]
MNMKLDRNWTTDNNGAPLNDAEVQRYISVVPTPSQQRLQDKPFYAFFHFGMNTANDREWGCGSEVVSDFDITKIKPEQWVKTVKAAGMTGIILTCKHHDGFCLWNTGTTDFNVMNSPMGKDIVKAVSDECHKQGIEFGVYLSPWDMHEPTYGTEQYNDYFIRQLTELCGNYGELFEVWFDGAKGANAKAFTYDWQRYYKLIRTMQPNANIAICGEDIRWVGNEAGKARKNEYSVVPASLKQCEAIEKNSQNAEGDAARLQKVDTMDEDLGSRNILKNNANLSWYPAEVDVSIRKGWFYHKKDDRTVKSARRLFKIYLTSVGNNCTLLLNIPPTDKGVICAKDVRNLKALGKKINDITAYPVLEQNIGELKADQGYLEFNFDSEKKLKYFVISEDLAYSQRIEKFDLYIKKPNGSYKRAYQGTIVGAKKIVKLNKKATGAVLVIRQSRSTPHIKSVGFYE